MTRDDLSEFLNQEKNGWDLDNRIHETAGRIEELFFPPVLKGVAFAETQRRWRMYVYNLLAFLWPMPTRFWLLTTSRSRKRTFCKLLWGKLNLKITLKPSAPP